MKPIIFYIDSPQITRINKIIIAVLRIVKIVLIEGV